MLKAIAIKQAITYWEHQLPGAWQPNIIPVCDDNKLSSCTGSKPIHYCETDSQFPIVVNVYATLFTFFRYRGTLDQGWPEMKSL